MKDKNLFTMKSLISEVVGSELPEEQDQMMDVVLTSGGILVVKMFDKTGDVLRSRISLKVRGSKAVEAFTDQPDGSYYQIRLDGGAVPVVFSSDNCELFMTAVDSLLAQS